MKKIFYMFKNVLVMSILVLLIGCGKSQDAEISIQSSTDLSEESEIIEKTERNTQILKNDESAQSEESTVTKNEDIILKDYGIEDKTDYEEIIQQSVSLDEDTYVDIIEWVDLDEGLLRVSVCSKEPQNELGILHEGDYFYYLNDDKINYFYVSYSYDSGERMVWMEPTFECILDDVNFDGEKDLLINLGKNGMSELEMYCLYIKCENGYEYCPSFEQICSYSLDKERKYVISNIQDGYMDYYQYQNGEFIMVQP